MAEGASYLLYHLICAHILHFQLKREYDTVKELHNASGFGWDPNTLHVTAELDVWNEYILVSTIACIHHIVAFTCPSETPQCCTFSQERLSIV